jgi:hypothetical protein
MIFNGANALPYQDRAECRKTHNGDAGKVIGRQNTSVITDTTRNLDLRGNEIEVIDCAKNKESQSCANIHLTHQDT